jgi:4-hydroxybenzoyl-CoA thioesterase
MNRFVHARRVRFADCDPAGIVFYPQYFVMLNGLVEDWINDELGISYHELVQSRRVGLPTVRLEAEFKAVSRLGDAVQLALGVERLGSRSLTLRLQCTGERGDDDLRMSLRQVIVTTSLQTHKSIEVPADLHNAVARFAQIASRKE